MKTGRKIALAAVAALAVVAAGAGIAIAATQPWSPGEEAQAVIDDAAEQLGVEPDELSDALKQALKNRVDEAVEEGRLTEEQGAELKERIDSSDSPLPFGPFGLRGPQLDRHPFADLDAAASFLGLSQAQLRSELAEGKSLAQVARAQSKSVDGLVQALVDAARERLEQAVEDGRLTEERAAEIEEELEDRITELVNREPGARPGLLDPGFGHRFDHRFDEFPGAPRFSGPRA